MEHGTLQRAFQRATKATKRKKEDEWSRFRWEAVGESNLSAYVRYQSQQAVLIVHSGPLHSGQQQPSVGI